MNMKRKLVRLFLLTAAIILLPVVLSYAGAEEKSYGSDWLYRIRDNVGRYGYINCKGEVVIEPQYMKASEFDEYGYAVALERTSSDNDKTGQYVLLDQKGNVIARAPEIRHNEISYLLTGFEGDLREGLFSPTTGTLIWYDGYILDEPANDPESTRVLVSPDGRHYGYLDRTTGEMVIPVQYDVVSYDLTQLSAPEGEYFIAYDFTCFHEGYAVAGVSDEDEWITWLINENGDKIPLPGEPVTNVHEGKLCVWKDSGHYICTVDGEILSDNYDEIRWYNNGYCAAINWYPKEKDDNEEVKRQFNYPELIILNEKGQEIYRQGNYIGHEKNDLPVEKNGYLCITEGDHGEYTEIHNVIKREQLCTVPDIPIAVDYDRELMVFTDGMYQYLCRLDGTMLFKLPFDACKASFRRRDPFKEDEDTNYLYEDGRWLLLADNADGERRYGYLDEEFNWAIPPQYIDAEPFYHGLAWCIDEEGCDLYIDTDGNTVWKGEKDGIYAAEASEALDLGGIWYKHAEDENSCVWLYIGVNSEHYFYADMTDDGWYRSDRLNMAMLENKLASVSLTRSAMETPWKKMEETVKRIDSVWHRALYDDDESTICLYSDGTYELIETMTEDGDRPMITDYGRREGHTLISEMPYRREDIHTEVMEEDGLLIYSYPVEVVCWRCRRPDGDGLDWYHPESPENEDLLPPETQGLFAINENGTWACGESQEYQGKWSRDGNMITFEKLDGSQFEMRIDEDKEQLYYTAVFRRELKRFPARTWDEIYFHDDTEDEEY